ncbi:MAG TPA: von Willebrand factor type A domain-containing protein, partial [Candidatus Omnitrophota bacterium]|nr:von Willebrand factor type A domain-containing protein [Candidatus Omnitrophota bacterium]
MPLHMVPAPGANDRFTEFESNRWIAVDEQPVSTFSADVDTASYAFVRRSLREGRLPPVEAVRVEEMVNYFPYAYPLPDRAGEPFKATVTVAPSPWTDGAKLVHIGVKGFDVARTARPRANLTFLIDTSGSMGPPDRLPLIKQAMNQLREGLHPDDSIAIVTYAGDARVALEPTKGSDIAKIEAAVQSLGAAGGTHGAAGIHTAYQLAEQMFDKEAVNRVILATDGDFNIGETNPKRLEEIVASKRKTGIYLTVLGVGIGNLNDGLMQRLAQTGNGQAAYLDSLL